jgi:hypothetical protein
MEMRDFLAHLIVCPQAADLGAENGPSFTREKRALSKAKRRLTRNLANEALASTCQSGIKRAVKDLFDAHSP